METDLIAGDVELKEYEGELALKTISGNIDVTILKAEIDAKTLTGTIYSDLDIHTIKSNTEASVASRIKGRVSKGGKIAKLETISGNIYIRKQ